MKNTSRLAFAFLFTAMFSFAAHSQIRQTHLYIDDGSGNFTILSAPSGGGAITLPASGTILTSTSAWTLTGNSGTTPGTDFIGTKDNVALEFKQDNMISGILDQAKSNTGFGTSALQNDLSQTGNNNTAVGHYAGTQITTGSNNTAVGSSALFSVATSSSNTAIGSLAMQNAADGSNNNTAVGVGALGHSGTYTDCTALGDNTNMTGGITDATAVGYSANVYGSNTMQLGDALLLNVNTHGLFGSHGISDTISGGATPAITILNSGSGNDVTGTSSSWSVTNTGAATVASAAIGGGTRLNVVYAGSGTISAGTSVAIPFGSGTPLEVIVTSTSSTGVGTLYVTGKGAGTFTVNGTINSTFDYIVIE